jgi:ATP-grasp domain, R2K clade family 2
MMATLLIPNKFDAERERVADAWIAQGGQILRIDKFWEKPNLTDGESVAIYGNDTFCLVLAQVLGVHLLMPDDALIADLTSVWTRRNIQISPLGKLVESAFPCFVKPILPKQFKAQVYADPAHLQETTAGISAQELVLVSEIVAILAEVRAFVLCGRVLDAACYEGEADVAAAWGFVQRFCDAFVATLPAAVVIDLAFDPDRGWMILELNAAWGAGLNGCDPAKVLPAIAAATTK